MRKNNAGWSLLEVTFVIMIAAIIASIAIPRIAPHMHRASAKEADYNFFVLGKEVGVLVGKKGDKSALNSIRHSGKFRDRKSEHFSYRVYAELYEEEMVYCMVATGNEKSSNPGKTILHSSSPSDAPGWDGRTSYQSYVGGYQHSSGGWCDGLSEGISEYYVGSYVDAAKKHQNDRGDGRDSGEASIEHSLISTYLRFLFPAFLGSLLSLVVNPFKTHKGVAGQFGYILIGQVVTPIAMHVAGLEFWLFSVLIAMYLCCIPKVIRKYKEVLGELSRRFLV